MNIEQFNILKEKYALQLDLLGIERPNQVNSSFLNDNFGYAKDFRNILTIFKNDQLLFDSFAYLEVFSGLRWLTIGKRDEILTLEQRPIIHIGCDLHKNRDLDALHVAVSVSSLHEDFRLFTPQLYALSFERDLYLHADAYDFKHLTNLQFGWNKVESSTNYTWFSKAPLYILTMVYVKEPVIGIDHFSKTLGYLKIQLCDISAITDKAWVSLCVLTHLHLNNVSMKNLPTWLAQLPMLREIHFGNTYNQLLYANDFSGKTIVIDQSLKHLKVVDIPNANVENLELHGNEDDETNAKFNLETLDITNSNLQTELEDVVSNLSIYDYYWTNAGPMGFDLTSVRISGDGFPYGLLKMANLSSYSGGYKFHQYESYYENNNVDIPWENVELGIENGDFDNGFRDDIYNQLKANNPDLKFRRVLEEEDIEDRDEVIDEDELEQTRRIENEQHELDEQRKEEFYIDNARTKQRFTPYCCIYNDENQELFGVDPFDVNSGTQCFLCFEPFLRSEHRENTDISTDFLLLPWKDDVDENKTVVFCNLTRGDAIHIPNNILTVDNSIAAHHKVEHLFHLDCFQRAIRGNVFRGTSPQCPINRDPFMFEENLPHD